jgi:hypothetical protein
VKSPLQAARAVLAYALRLTYGYRLLRATWLPGDDRPPGRLIPPSSPSAAHSAVNMARHHAASAIPLIVCHIPQLTPDIEVKDQVE